jgi:hypothetical protein
MIKMDVQKGMGRILWGASPLPIGAEIVGIVIEDANRLGALIRLANGNHVQGNAGSIRTLPDMLKERG